MTDVETAGSWDSPFGKIVQTIGNPTVDSVLAAVGFLGGRGKEPNDDGIDLD